MEIGKTSKYFKYAIGEIVLVVIGILIALSINNWNEQRKTEVLEKSYNQSIKNDLKGDHKTIEYIVKETKLSIDAYELLMEQLKSFDTINDSRPLYTLLFNNRGFPDLKVSDNTIETLKNSGNIEIISSLPVRNVIQSYYDLVEIIYLQQDFMNSNGIHYIMGKFFNYLECEKGIENNTKVPFDDRARENLPDTYASLIHWVDGLKWYVTLLDRLDKRNADLINLINSHYPEK
jgi:hypothetical protein